MTARPARRRAAVLLALPLLLSACAGDAEPSAAPAPSAAATSTPAAAPAASTPATTAPPVDDATSITLTVAGGKVTGDTGRAPVAIGDTVRLSVTADVVDEVHVHGYDLYLDTVPGQAAQLEFTADKPGIFEVELEGAGTLLTRLQVQ